MATKKWYLSKTLWLNGLMIVASILLLATKSLTLSQVEIEWILFAWGSLNVVIRFLTNGPISLK